MSAGLLLLLSLAPPAEDAPPRGALILLAKDDIYRKAKGPEVTLDGLVERTPTPGKIEPARRFNVFRLRYQGADGKEALRELHVPDKAYLVSSHLGKKVRVRGKLVETKADGTVHLELWPAWVVPLTGEIADRPAADGVFARCDWQPDAARVRGRRTYVIRSGEELAKTLRVSGPSAAQTATAFLAQRLRVPAIDWNKQMLVCVSAGLQGPAVGAVAIERAAESGGLLRITYRLVPAKGGGFGYPAQTALVRRTAAEVRFDEVKSPGERGASAP